MWISQFNTVKTSAIVDPVFMIQRLCLHKESMPFMRPTAKNVSRSNKDYYFTQFILYQFRDHPQVF